jgi:hypothetical protein
MLHGQTNERGCIDSQEAFRDDPFQPSCPLLPHQTSSLRLWPAFSTLGTSSTTAGQRVRREGSHFHQATHRSHPSPFPLHPHGSPHSSLSLSSSGAPSKHEPHRTHSASRPRQQSCPRLLGCWAVVLIPTVPAAMLLPNQALSILVTQEESLHQIVEPHRRAGLRSNMSVAAHIWIHEHLVDNTSKTREIKR